MRVYLLAISAFLIFLAIVSGGSAPFGRLALALGLPEFAGRIFVDPSWRGVAYYRAGKHELAVKAFKQAGPDAAYNLGNAFAYTHYYAASLEAYDRAMAKDRDDAQARANFDLVAAFYAGTRIDADALVKWSRNKDGPTMAANVARGDARASGTGDAVTNTSATIGLVHVESREQGRVRKIFDDKYVVASPRWLATLEDVPGTYLAARILHEHKRRAKAGEGQPQAAQPW
ncbi:MAG: hypothetical protein GY742_03950 [Hyphomicrobiales bacterium]|nr:hypothetical protein [Hyphomicrobiales bacterium]